MKHQSNRDESTPRVAILGAGPIGLEAALYARYLGFETAVFEKGDVADSVRRWGHVKMFSPFGMNRSTLGAAALQAQDEHCKLPADDEILTGMEYAQQYLIPLSKSDLLSDCIFPGVEVLAIGRDGILKSDIRDTDRSQYSFRLLVRENQNEDIVDADVVIDASGVYKTPNYLGHGGIPALGEFMLRDSIDYQLADVLGADRARFENRQVLVVGSGYSAATSIVALGELHQAAPETTVTWITRRSIQEEDGPITRIPHDRLPEREQLARRANALARDPTSGVTHRGQTSVIGITLDDVNDQFLVKCAGAVEVEHRCDRIIANVGFRPDDAVYDELQIHQCFASQGPMKLAAALLSSDTTDCLDQESAGPQTLLNPEPNFFILGSKSYGRSSNFLLTAGLEQIRDVFTIIAEREDLDLYKTMEHAVS